MPTPLRAALLAFGCLVAGRAVAAQDEPGAWKKIQVKEGGFEVLFPSEPQQQKQVAQSAAGPLDVHLRILSRPQPFLVLVAGVSEVPKALTDGKTAEQYLREEIDGSLRSLKAERLSETDKPLGEHPGRETLAEAEKFDVTSRAYLVKGRYIQLMALTLKGEKKDREGDVKKFLDSLTLADAAPSK